jgi:small subunit ribosomal protein S1
VQILDIDSQKRRISLGIKQLEENPWPTLAEKYPVGHDMDGVIGRMLDHGIIVELENDLEGFVPLGHLAIPKVEKPQYYFEEGENLELKVIKMDVENRRIVLSIAERLKELGPETTEEFIAKHPLREDVVAADREAEAEAAAEEDLTEAPRAEVGDEGEAETKKPVPETVEETEPATPNTAAANGGGEAEDTTASSDTEDAEEADGTAEAEKPAE